MQTERKERQRAAVRDEIKTTARAHMARDGAAALSLRAVATEMGLSSAAIYYYYANRDALITDLIVDAYRALGAALRASIAPLGGADIGERLLTAMKAYRAWAVEHPSEYALLFGTPIPGYQGPAEITAPEARIALFVFGELFAEAERAGRLRLGATPVPPQIAGHIAGWTPTLAPGASIASILATVRAWSVGHGMVGLELDSHLQPIVGDAAELYTYESRELLRGLGVI